MAKILNPLKNLTMQSVYFRIKCLLNILLLLPLQILAQQNDSTHYDASPWKFNYKQLIIPACLISYDAITMEDELQLWINGEVKNELQEHIDSKITIDDFTQFAPAAAAYSLNLCGIKGKNNLRNKSLILATSYLLMTTTVTSMKNIIKARRPDGSSYNSFPSGHTATAFVGAEFLFQEYKEESIWYGISGYAVAAGTGFFRMYNNRHWLSDVAAGAGIGILSTKAAYWLQPFLQRKLLGTKNKTAMSNAMILPFYNGQQVGAGLVIGLK